MESLGESTCDLKNEGSLGEAMLKKGGLLSLTYASPPEWDPGDAYKRCIYYRTVILTGSRYRPVQC